MSERLLFEESLRLQRELIWFMHRMETLEGRLLVDCYCKNTIFACIKVLYEQLALFQKSDDGELPVTLPIIVFKEKIDPT